MSMVNGISATEFPKQGRYLGQRVRVCYNYDYTNVTEGTCIRDDTEEPGQMIFQLDDGRVVRSVECLWQPMSPPVASGPTDG
jgi:hypothetical protein